MTVAAPPPDAQIDWEALHLVDDEAAKLLRDGRFDQSAYARLKAAGVLAVGKHVEQLDTLEMLWSASHWR